MKYVLDTNVVSALMRGVLASKNAPVASLDLLSEAERAQVLSAFQGPERAFPLDRSLIDLFLEQASLAPNRPALIHEGLELTYGDLHRRAAEVARRLKEAHGARPGDQALYLVLVLAAERAVVLDASRAIVSHAGPVCPSSEAASTATSGDADSTLPGRICQP